jgi:hypothetical protein
MNIVILYGPPAVGKLTVARELSKCTGYKVLHVHLVADFIASVFPFGSKEVIPLMEKIRLELLKAAQKNKKIEGIILTAGYEPKGKVDLRESFLKKLDAMAGGKTFFVRLKCDERGLYKRMGNKSRRLFQKPRKKEILRYLLKNFRLDAPVKLKKSLMIDNTMLSASACAKRIKSFYKF